MNLETRHDLFGDPTVSLVAEAVWALHEDTTTWPLWQEAVEDLAQWQKITEDEAERRILAAIRDGEVLARLQGPLWMLELDESAESRIRRRYLDNSLRRKEDAP